MLGGNAVPIAGQEPQAVMSMNHTVHFSLTAFDTEAWGLGEHLTIQDLIGGGGQRNMTAGWALDVTDPGSILSPLSDISSDT